MILYEVTYTKDNYKIFDITINPIKWDDIRCHRKYEKKYLLKINGLAHTHAFHFNKYTKFKLVMDVSSDKLSQQDSLIISMITNQIKQIKRNLILDNLC